MHFALVILLFSTVKSLKTPDYTYSSKHLSIEANLVKTGPNGLQHAVYNSLAKAIAQIRSLAFDGVSSSAVDSTKLNPAMGPYIENIVNSESRGSNGRDSRLDESPKQKLELPGWFKNTRVPEVKNRWKPFKTSYRTDKTMVTPGFTTPSRSTARSSPTVVGRRTPPPSPTARSGPMVWRKTPSTTHGVLWLPPALEDRQSTQAPSTPRTSSRSPTYRTTRSTTHRTTRPTIHRTTRPTTHRTTRSTPISEPMLWPVSERFPESPAHDTTTARPTTHRTTRSTTHRTTVQSTHGTARTPQPPTSYESRLPPPSVSVSGRMGGTGAEKDPFRRFWTLALPSEKQDGSGEIVIEGGNPMHANPVQILLKNGRIAPQTDQPSAQ